MHGKGVKNCIMHILAWRIIPDSMHFFPLITWLDYKEFVEKHETLEILFYLNLTTAITKVVS